MNMITVDQYFRLVEKNDLNPEEKVKIGTFETFIRLCKKYESLISEAALSVLKEYNSKVMSLANKESKNSHEENILKEFNSSFEESSEKIVSVGAPTRKLTKAGYIDATIILTILLNIGFIVAVTLIGR